MIGFRTLLDFEVEQKVKSISTVIMLAVVAALTVLAFQLDIVQVGLTAKSYRNSPISIARITTVFSTFGVFLIAPVMGSALLREQKYRFQGLYYSMPMESKALYYSRFTGTFIRLLIIFFSTLVVISLVSFIQSEDDSITAFSIVSYINVFLIFLLPNLLISSMIFYGITSFIRQISVVYALPIVFFIVHLILTILGDNPSFTWVAYLEPFGIEAMELITEYWTLHEQNNSLIPLTGELLANRITWLTISTLLFLIGAGKFRLSLRTDGNSDLPLQPDALFRHRNNEPVKAVIDESTWITLINAFLGSLLEFQSFLKSRLFWVFIVGGFFFLHIDQWFADRVQGTLNYPVTYMMVEVDSFTYVLYAYAIILFYSGTLIWKERDVQFHEISDTTPFPNWARLLQKFLSVSFISFALTFLIFLSGITIQSLKGYYNYELDLYARTLFGIFLPDLLMFQALAFCMLTLIKNKYAGLLSVIVLWTITSLLPSLGVEHPMLIFSSLPPYIYSDLNGFGHFWKGIFWFNIYWLLGASLLYSSSLYFWPRGYNTNPKRLSKSLLVAVTSILVSFVLVAIFLINKTTSKNQFTTEDDLKEYSYQYEKRYSYLKEKDQPKIISVNVNVDIFPKERKVSFNGSYLVKNKTSTPIQELVLSLKNPTNYKSISLSRVNKIIVDDLEIGIKIFSLSTPLEPNDSLSITYELTHQDKGIGADNPDTEIVYNGSVISGEHLPKIGYQPSFELADNKIRKEYGLALKQTKKPWEETAKKTSFAGNDSDWISFSTQVSTSEDQIALAPGSLIDSWKINGRNYFKYEFDHSIKSLAWVSGNYEVTTDSCHIDNRYIRIEIYHDPSHKYNVDDMLKAAKSSLKYYSDNYSPYQFDEIRIAEFPRFTRGAFSLPALIPFSESFGFLLKAEPAKPNIPFHITAHEVAHQWWGYQVIPADADGARMIGESLSQYSALQVLKSEYGLDKALDFLQYERRRYLLGHARSDKEPPLYLVENQSFIHSKKGSLAFNAIKQKIGEHQLNADLSQFLKKYAFKSYEYPTTIDLIETLSVPEPSKSDILKKNYIHDLSIEEARSSKKGHEYWLQLDIDFRKFEVVGSKEEQVQMTDLVRIKILNDEDSTLFDDYIKYPYTDPIRINSPPYKVIIDPYLEFIERKSSDNTTMISANGG